MTYGLGDLRAHVEEAYKICVDVDLAAAHNASPSYARVGAAAAKRLSYAQEWQAYIDNREYDILLRDQSLLQFKIDLDSERTPLSYTYYENPYDILSYEDFLHQTYGTSDPQGDTYVDLYQEYLGSSHTLKPYVLPMRYDFSPGLYVEGSHPASHVHIGHRNSVRIGTRKVLRPTSFVLFVLRQAYPASWRVLLGQEATERRARQVSQELQDVDGRFFGRHDRKEMHLL